jgi:pilus assembly protein CpaF
VRVASLSERVAAALAEGRAQPSATLHDELRVTLHFRVIEELGPVLYDRALTDDELRRRVLETLERSLDQEARSKLSKVERDHLLAEITSDVLGYGPIDPLLTDPTVTEVMVNGPYEVYVERAGKIVSTPIRFVDGIHLRRIIDKIVGQVGRRVDEATPMVDARLPDGSRVNAVVHPLAIGGPFLTIRKFAVDPFTENDLINLGTLTRPLADLAKACVLGRLNIVISGGTGSGKTTTLNVLSSYLPAVERIVTIEDAAELQLNQDHVLSLESRPANLEGKGEVTMRDLVRNALRMRPDRIVVGEVRGGESLDMLQAMNTGHDGSLTTVHANSPRDSLSRIETMVLMAGFDLPVRAIREQIASAVNLVIHIARLRDGTRRVTHVSEVGGMVGDQVELRDLFLFDYGMGLDIDGRFLGRLKATGRRPEFLDHLRDVGIEVPPGAFDAEPVARRTDSFSVVQ